MSRAFNSNGSMPHMVNSLITHAKQDLTHYPELANLLRGTSLKLAKGLMVDGLQVPRIDGDVMLESGFLGLIDQVCAAGAERALVAAVRLSRHCAVSGMWMPLLPCAPAACVLAWSRRDCFVKRSLIG